MSEEFFSDPDAVPKLIYNDETGDGEIKFPPDWKKGSVIWRIDCLQDWIDRLQEEYDRAQMEFAEQSNA